MDKPVLDHPPLPAPAVSALVAGNKIEAIRVLRQERQPGLREAKDAVDRYVRAQPAMQASYDAAQAKAKRRLFWGVALAIAARLWVARQILRP